MCSFAQLPSNCDTRYEVTMNYQKDKKNVYYEMSIYDLALGRERKLVFRFSNAEKFHDQLVRKMKNNIDHIPEFPKKNSLAFWNKTNDDHRKIE